MILPTMPKGRPSDSDRATYCEDMQEFAALIEQINSRLDFKPGARGWCYLLEEHGLSKGDFAKAEDILTKCRYHGLLPLDICAEDSNRVANESPCLYDRMGIDDFVKQEFDCITHQYSEAENDAVNSITNAVYTPHSFWESQDFYLEMMVEKIDLRSLFDKVCSPYHIPITNSKGWADLHSRASILRRMQPHAEAGRQCVILYCGDHDPAGLHISDCLRKNVLALNRTRYSDGQTLRLDPDMLTVDRFGLNHDFIIRHNLSWVENLTTSSGKDLANPRHKGHHAPHVQSYLEQYGARKCEANALVVRPEAGRALAKEAIFKYLNLESIKEVQENNQHATRQARARLVDMANGFDGWDIRV